MSAGPRIAKTAYGDVCISGAVPCDSHAAFEAFLRQHLASANRGVWLQLPFTEAYVSLLPIAYACGFRLHHGVKSVLTLQAWCKEGANPTPAYGHHAAGSGAFVVNSKGRVLGIRERFDTSGSWHMPGGHVDEGESFVDAAVREAWEESGCRVQPISIAAWYELQMPFVPPPEVVRTPDDEAKMEQSIRFGTTHFSACVLCVALDDTLTPDSEEIAEAAWLEPEEFARRTHPHMAVLTHAIVRAGLCAAIARFAQTGALDVLPSITDKTAGCGTMASIRLDMQHRRFPCTHSGVVYTALPPALLIAAAEETPTVVRATVLTRCLTPAAAVADSRHASEPAVASATVAHAPQCASTCWALLTAAFVAGALLSGVFVRTALRK